jgi:hypothetical protein
MDKLRFSGHETFIARTFWPKKGYDFIIKKKRGTILSSTVIRAFQLLVFSNLSIIQIFPNPTQSSPLSPLLFLAVQYPAHP